MFRAGGIGSAGSAMALPLVGNTETLDFED